MGPGMIEFTRMCSPANSKAATLVNPRNAHFEAV